MKRILTLIVITIIATSILAQKKPVKNITSYKIIDFLDTLSQKKSATINDLFTLYLEIKKLPGRNFASQRNELIKLKMISKNEFKDGNQFLRRGLLARITAKELNLTDSFLYRITGSDRYAYRACTYALIMRPGLSTYDIISGQELIEIMQLISAHLEGSE